MCTTCTAGTSPAYKKPDEDKVLLEIYLYAQDQKKSGNHRSLPINSVTRVDVYKKDIKKIKAENSGNRVILALVLVGALLTAFGAFLNHALG